MLFASWKLQPCSNLTQRQIDSHFRTIVCHSFVMSHCIIDCFTWASTKWSIFKSKRGVTEMGLCVIDRYQIKAIKYMFVIEPYEPTSCEPPPNGNVLIFNWSSVTLAVRWLVETNQSFTPHQYHGHHSSTPDTSATTWDLTQCHSAPLSIQCTGRLQIVGTWDHYCFIV